MNIVLFLPSASTLVYMALLAVHMGFDGQWQSCIDYMYLTPLLHSCPVICFELRPQPVRVNHSLFSQRAL